MKWRWLVVVGASLGLLAGGPALAKHKRHHYRANKVSGACADRPVPFSWAGILFNPKPGPNGCAPPVFQYGEYIGQDPDPSIRHELRRDPTTGYSMDLIK